MLFTVLSCSMGKVLFCSMCFIIKSFILVIILFSIFFNSTKYFLTVLKSLFFVGLFSVGLLIIVFILDSISDSLSSIFTDSLFAFISLKLITFFSSLSTYSSLYRVRSTDFS